jgi:hypothetical protein
MASKEQSYFENIKNPTTSENFDFWEFVAFSRPKLKINIPDTLIRLHDGSIHYILNDPDGYIAFEVRDIEERFFINVKSKHRTKIRGTEYAIPIYIHKTPTEKIVVLFDEKKARFLWNACPHDKQILQMYVPPST